MPTLNTSPLGQFSSRDTFTSLVYLRNSSLDTSSPLILLQGEIILLVIRWIAKALFVKVNSFDLQAPTFPLTIPRAIWACTLG